MISGGDVAHSTTHTSRRVARSRRERPSSQCKLAAQTGMTVSALVGGAVVTLSYGHLLWANAILSLSRCSSCCASPSRRRARSGGRNGRKSSRRSRPRWYGTPRGGRVPHLVASGAGGLVMFWVKPEILAGERGAPGMVRSSAGWLQSHPRARREIGRSQGDEIRRATDARRRRRVAGHRVFRDGVVPRLGRDIAWGPGPDRPGPGRGAFLEALNERISSAFRATVISMANLGIRASFCLLGPLVGYGIDGWGLPPVLSALGILFSIAFVFLLLPLILKTTALSPADSRAAGN